MKMNYRYKLKPTTEQNATMIEWLNCCRNQYNYRLGERFCWWEATRTPVNACPLNVSVVPIKRIYQNIPEFRTQVRDGRKLGQDGLPITRKGDKHPNIVGGYVQWQTVQLADLKNTKKQFLRYKNLHSQVLQDVINRVETAFSNFIKPNKNGDRSGKPRFKGLHYYKSFSYSQLKNKHIDEKKGYVELPGIGFVKAIFHRPIPSGFVVKVGTVKLEADGWYISLAIEDKTVPNKEEEVISPTKQNSIGIDLGLERFLTQDNGSYVEIPQFLRRSSKRLARLQHRKDKLKKGSKDQKKLHIAIAKLHQKIARQRLNFHFHVAYQLFEQADVVFVEDLKLRNLIRRNKPKPALKDTASHNGQGGFLPNRQAQKTGMNKSWLDAGHSSFVAILEWVAWKLGKRVIKVDPWGTSQFCSSCLQKTPKTLSDRWHEHRPCGISIHRDHNSARLIKSVGLGLASLKTAPPREKRLALYATA